MATQTPKKTPSRKEIALHNQMVRGMAGLIASMPKEQDRIDMVALAAGILGQSRANLGRP